MSPQKRTGSEHTPIITGYKDEGDKENNRTLQNDEEYVKYKPGVGWLGFMVSGVFNINRKPIIELSTTVHCDKSKWVFVDFLTLKLKLNFFITI